MKGPRGGIILPIVLHRATRRANMIQLRARSNQFEQNVLRFLCRDLHPQVVLRDEASIMAQSTAARAYEDQLRIKAALTQLLELEQQPPIAGLPNGDAPTLLLQALCILNRTNRITWPAPSK